MIFFLSVMAPQNNAHYFVAGCKSSLQLQCDVAGNASKVAILSYTMAGRTEVNMLMSGDNVPMRAESESEQVTSFSRHALSSRNTVLVELRLSLQLCLTERKTGLQQHHDKMCKYGIWKIFSFHTSNLPFHT